MLSKDRTHGKPRKASDGFRKNTTAMSNDASSPLLLLLQTPHFQLSFIHRRKKE
jgi:hypothetical protein